MPDLERDLARYGTVLRDRAPAVRVDEVESRLHRPPTSHRPVRAAVAGAVLTLASIGLIFATGTLIDVLGRAPSTEAPTVAPAAGSTSGPAALAVVAGGGAVAILLGAAAVGLKRRQEKGKPKRLAKTRERRKKKMQTLEKPVAPIERLERNNRFLIVGLVVAVLLAAGLGAWLIVDNVRTGIEADIAAVIDEYGAAWEAGDGEALAAFVTEDFRVLAGDGITYSLEEISSLLPFIGFTVEPVGTLVIHDTASGWHVAAQDSHGMELFNIVDRDGRLLIHFHETWLGISTLE